MDWFSVSEPLPYLLPYTDIEPADPPAAGGLFTAWLVLAGIALVAAVMWYRQRSISSAPSCDGLLAPADGVLHPAREERLFLGSGAAPGVPPRGRSGPAPFFGGRVPQTLPGGIECR
jgi:hypothetical protein